MPIPVRTLLRALLLVLVLVLVSAIVASGARAASFDPARMPTLRQGARGAPVRTFQAALDEWRALRGRPAIGVDGDFGPATRSAAIDFQRAIGLYPDGVAGSLTWRALAAVTVATPPPSGGPVRDAEAARQEAAWTRARMPGRFSVTNMASNGGRPVAVWVPEGFDPDLPVRALTYFHGHGGDVGLAFAANGVLVRLRDLGARHPQTLFVCPEAASAPFSYWMRAPGESFAGLEREAAAEALRLAGASSSSVLGISQRIVSAHSGGGLALRNAVAANELRADWIELLDCAYGDWAQEVVRWALTRPAADRPLIEAWHTPGATEQNDLDIARRAPSLVTAHRSPVAHGAVPGRFLGTALEY